MTTTAVPITITCPDWCSVTAEAHAEQLWNMGGCCIHESADAVVEDTAGYVESVYDQPRFHEPIGVSVSTMTRPEDGRETATPIVRLDGTDLSVQQALALADTLRAVVETYRAAGGVA